MPSRIIVKNLPKYISLERFRELFASKGEVTDAKVMMTSSGHSRQFGFVGYKSDEEAMEAVRYFDKSFVDTMRLSVELAKPYGSENSRTWSKHTKTAAVIEEPKTRKSDDPEIDKLRKEALKKKHLAAIGIGADDKLNEYLQIMKPRSQMKAWENDDLIGADIAVSDESKVIPSVPKSVTVSKGNDDDLYEDMPGFDQTIDAPTTASEAAADSGKDIVDTAKAEESVEEAYDEVELSGLSLLAETGRLFLRNLPFSTTEDDLKALFSKYGSTSEVHIPIETSSKKSKGIAYVSFMIPENAVKAFSDLDGTIFQGRLLHLIPAREKRVVEIPEHMGSSFKNAKQKKLKENASNDSVWNSLFMSADAVADSMAKKLNVNKSDILDRESDGMAVRMALAETHIIQETVKYLEEEGVCIDAFKNNMRKERSDVVVMIKNIPFNTDERDIKEMFSRHGDIIRITLPPTRTMALVEYSNANEAKSAFKTLCFKNFKGKPLLLEMAPTGVYSRPANQKPKSDPARDTAALLGDEEPSLESATIFVKNLNFTTTNERLASVFQGLEGFRSAKISMKKHQKSGKLMSMGFGFVEFSSNDCAKNAIKLYQGQMLEDHAIQLKFSDKSQSSTSKSGGKEVKVKGSKLLVRNVPFEATKKDLTDLFGTYGQLKRVRLPKKVDNKTHRGFAFIDFLTKQEAKNAFESLANTHLYGRHLVIEWAEDEDSLDVMRERTRDAYESALTEANAPSNKRVKLSDDEDEMIDIK